MTDSINHLRVDRIVHLHSSTVRIYLRAPREESDVNSISLTLDFCIWDLYKDGVGVVGSDSDVSVDLEAGLSCLIGCDILSIKMIEEISRGGVEIPVYLNIVFTDKYRIAVSPHESDPDVPEEKAPLITISRKNWEKQYFSDGSVEISV